MKTIKQFCLLALVLVFVSSCSLIVHTDYELVDCGKVLSVDADKMSLGIYSFSSGRPTEWYSYTPSIDGLSMEGGQYQSKISVGDTVNIYRDGNKFIATRYDIKDAQAINQTLASYYWQNIAENWWVFLIFFCVFGIVGYGTWQKKHENYWLTAYLICVVLGIAISLSIYQAGGRLHVLRSGTITAITSSSVRLNNSTIIPYATLEDISTHHSVKVGQDVVVYSYRFGGSEGANFLSTRKLNDFSLRASQSYPESFLMTLMLFVITTLVTQGMVYYLSGRWRHSQEEKKK